MTQIASPESVAPSFDGVRVNDLPAGPMFLERRGRELWADFADSDGALLFRVDGTFNAPLVNRLIMERSNRKVVYRE